MQYEIAGKKLDEDFACYVCGKPMSPQQLDVTVIPYYLEPHRLEWNPCSQEITAKFRCVCGLECELIMPERAIAVVSREPKEPETWEYVIMGVTSVKYGRVKNLGNYETERLEAEVVVAPDQTADAALIEARTFVNKKLGLGPTSDEVDAARRILEEAGEL